MHQEKDTFNSLIKTSTSRTLFGKKVLTRQHFIVDFLITLNLPLITYLMGYFPTFKYNNFKIYYCITYMIDIDMYTTYTDIYRYWGDHSKFYT